MTVGGPWKTETRILVGIGAVFVYVLAYQLINRIPFPWDYYVWSESPFLTNLWKMSLGQPIFTNPSDVNSFLYSPGLEVLVYGLLSPFGLELDIRFARFIVVGLGAAAAVLTAVFARRLLVVLGVEPSNLRKCGWLMGFLFTLIIFKSATSDVCHPDNFQMFHVAAGLCLGAVTIATGEFRWALTTIIFLATGVLIRQSAALGFVGVLIVFMVEFRRVWNPAKTIILCGAGIAVFALSLWLLIGRSDDAAFFLFKANALDWAATSVIKWVKLKAILTDMLSEQPHRIMLWVAAVFSAWWLLVHENRLIRRLIRFWLVFGLAEGVPALASFGKVFAWWNNLTVIDLWAAAIAMPAILSIAVSAKSERPFVGGAVFAFFAILFLTMSPAKYPPSDREQAFMAEWEGLVREDFRKGKRVLVSHGTSILIRAGEKDVPIDRGNTMNELNVAGLARQAGTRRRIEGLFYSRIYLSAPQFFGHSILETIDSFYMEVGRVYAPRWEARSRISMPIDWAWGYQPDLWQDVVIYEPRNACESPE